VDRKLHPSTIAVRAGRGRGGHGDAVNPPVVLSSTFHAGGDVVYGRESNETWEAFESALGALEGGLATSFSSGMAAVAAVLSTVPVGGVVVAPDGAYTGVRWVLNDLESQGRLTVRLVDIASVSAVGAAAAGAALVWAESPTNPTMGVADLAAIAGLAHDAGAVFAVDNTFATPMLQRPLSLGADIVVHSVTKALAGHSDVLMGAVVVAEGPSGAPLADAVYQHRVRYGAVPGPMETFLALRGLRTLDVRLQRAQSTAMDLATRLSSHPAVERVRYPGLASDPAHELAARQMDGFGSMLSFDVVGGPDAAAAADKVCAAFELVIDATSLGGVETTAERRGKYAGEESTPPGLIRMSVGLEHPDDLWSDLDQALSSIDGGQ
jgi:cystathionine gamma-synthase